MLFVRTQHAILCVFGSYFEKIYLLLECMQVCMQRGHHLKSILLVSGKKL